MFVLEILPLTFDCKLQFNTYSKYTNYVQGRLMWNEKTTNAHHLGFNYKDPKIYFVGIFILMGFFMKTYLTPLKILPPWWLRGALGLVPLLKNRKYCANGARALAIKSPATSFSEVPATWLGLNNSFSNEKTLW